MQLYSASRSFQIATGLALLGCSGGIHADVGARVVLQAWNPVTPDQANVTTLVDEPTLVSDSLRDAWADARPKICAQIKGRLGVGGAAGGQTLYDITCILDQTATLEVTGQQNTLLGAFTVGGYFEATSTTPTVFGSYADPRVSVALRAKLDLVVAVQPDPDHALRVTKARFTLNNASLDSHNAVADVLEFVSDDLIPFFGGPNFKRQAEDAVNAVAIDLVPIFDAALAPVNAKLKGPAGAVRVGVAANGRYISMAFAPRESTPTLTGKMSGVLRWDPSQFAPRNGCQSFDIRATVQTGPVPMYTANAEAPKRQVGSFQASSASPNSCGFTMTGLAAGWPHVLSARVIDGSAVRGTGSALYGVSYGLVGDGWDGRKVVPAPVASNRNYLVSRSIDASATTNPDYSSARAQVAQRTDPRVNPAGDYAAQKVVNRSDLVTAGASDSVRLGDTVTLNPQPLPPRAGSPAQSPAQDRAAEAGIIIVSGKNSGPLATKTPGLGSRMDAAVIAAANVQTRSADGIDFDELASRGSVIAAADPSAMELRGQQPDDAAVRGFDIGMAAAEGQTVPGPGKQRIHDSLPPAERAGYAAAVEFSLARNRQKIVDFAPRGAELADADPLATELRNRQPEGPARLGFDIGMAVAEGQTAPGPGKDRIRDSLLDAEKGGFLFAVAFSLDRNRNAERAATGAAIAAADAAVAAARNAQPDVLHKLGFDIATAIFGDPALGAQGNTATGPGSMAIRNALSPSALQGFDEAVRYHLRQRYAR